MVEQLYTCHPATVSLGSLTVIASAQHSGRIKDKPDGLRGLDGLSVVVPAWNEEFRLPKTLDRYLGLFESYGRPFEVIVVADGVTDRTAQSRPRMPIGG